MEMIAFAFHSKVRANGGILSGQDISNYNVEMQEPLEGRYNGKDDFQFYTVNWSVFVFLILSVSFILDFIIQVPPPPSAGAALIAALNLLEAFHLGENNATESQVYHWIAEVLVCFFCFFFFHCRFSRNPPTEWSWVWILFSPHKSLAAALVMASGLGDPKYNSSVTELLSIMLRCVCVCVAAWQLLRLHLESHHIH